VVCIFGFGIAFGLSVESGVREDVGLRVLVDGGWYVLCGARFFCCTGVVDVISGMVRRCRSLGGEKAVEERELEVDMVAAYTFLLQYIDNDPSQK
jgi:hypothetical protein